MAFIETELAKRRGGQVNDDPSKNGPADPQEELYRIAEKYRLEQKKPRHEEVDLGME
jgi:hypothetical protein